MTTIRVHPDMTITADKYKLGVRGDRGFEKFTIIAPEEHEGVDLSSLTGKLRYQLSDNRINTMYMGTPSNSDGVLTYTDFETLPENAESYPGMFSTDQWIYVSISWEHSDGSLYKSTVPNNNFQIMNSIALDGELAAQNPDSILDLRNNKLDKTGDGKDVTVTFSEAETDTNITSGSKISKMFKIIQNVIDSFLSHVANISNPHSVTKSQVGLGNVDNTSDADKPISTAAQTALNSKLPLSPYKSQLDNLAQHDIIPPPPVGDPGDLTYIGTDNPGDRYYKRGYYYNSPGNVSGPAILCGPYIKWFTLGPPAEAYQSYLLDVTESICYRWDDSELDWIVVWSGTNTGDETAQSIKSKLGITVLSGQNTGDQDLSGYVQREPGKGLIDSDFEVGQNPYFGAVSARYADNAYAAQNASYAGVAESALGYTSNGGIDLALQSKESTANKNQPNGYAGLDATGKILPAQLPSNLISSTTYEAPWKTGSLSVSGSVFTLTGHDFTDGAPVEFRANTGVLPGGVLPFNSDNIGGTYYNVTVLDANTFVIYEDVERTIKVIPSDSGTAGYQIRLAEVSNILITGLDGDRDKHYLVVYENFATVKRTTLTNSFFFRLNNSVNYKYINTATSHYAQDAGTTSIQITNNKYTVATLILDVLKQPGGDYNVLINCHGKMTNNKTSTTTLSVVGGTVVKGVTENLTTINCTTTPATTGRIRNGVTVNIWRVS